MNEDQKQQLENIRTMITDMATYVTEDVGRMLEPLTTLETDNEELRKEIDRLRTFADQSNLPFDKQVGLEHFNEFWESALANDVDPQQWIQYRLGPVWEVKAYFDHDDIATYTGAAIREMLRERGFVNATIDIDDAKTFKVPRSPGMDGGLGSVSSWGNAYYYKGMCHYAGVESVGITNFGTIIGVEERIRTAGSAGVVARFLRPHTANPGDVLPRKWNNAIIWPDAGDYTEIRF